MCQHFEGLPPASCDQCLYEGVPAAPARRKNDGKPWRAKYDGECTLCAAGIRKGELIVDLGHGLAHYSHTAGGVRP